MSGLPSAVEVGKVPHHPVVEETQEVAIRTKATTALNSLQRLKWPYRVCSIGLIWTPECCPTLGGDRRRSDRMLHGTWKEKEEQQVEQDLLLQ